MKKIIKTFALTFVFASPVFAGEPVKVSTATFQPEKYVMNIKSFGKAKDLNSVEISSVSNKEVVFIKKVGDKIEKGELLVKLELENLREELKFAELKVEELKLLLKSKEKLFNKGNVSEYEVVQSRTNLASAQSNLRAMREKLADREVLSPVSGEVVAVYKNIGEYTDSEILLEVSSLTNKVGAQVLSKYSRKIKSGSNVKFETVDGLFYEGVVGFVSPKVNLNNTVDVEVELFQKIKPNMSGDLVFGLVPLDAIKIPSSALVINNGSDLYVFENDQGKAKMHKVDVINFVDDHVVVKPFVNKKIDIVTAGQYYLEDGIKIETRK